MREPDSVYDNINFKLILTAWLAVTMPLLLFLTKVYISYDRIRHEVPSCDRVVCVKQGDKPWGEREYRVLAL